MQNKHLYRGVQINFDITNAELHESILQAVTVIESQGEINVIKTPQNHFRQINNAKNILRRNFHQ